MITEGVAALPHAKNAAYNTRQAPDDQESQGCMEGTREQILDDLEEWAVNDAAPKVFWLNGMAGTGKTSIAHSLSERLDNNQILGASFFCSRSASQEVRDASLIIPTIASALSQVSPLLRSTMSKVVKEKPDVGSLHKLSVQFRLLLVEPIKSVLDSSLKTFIIIIDALDECTKLVTAEKFIQAVEFTPDTRLKFFISSQDTTQIRSAFNHNPTYSPRIVSLHTIERTVVQDDIKLYLHTSLSAIIAKNPLPTPWPPLDEFDILLKWSDRLFIYAATALRYIGAPDVDFRERLIHITRLTPARMQTGVIDSLYNDIMRQAFCSQLEPEDVSRRHKILSAVVFLLVPLSMDAIAYLLSMDRLQAQVALAPFCSVIHVPPTADISPVTMFHTSFPEFIIHPSRCEEPFRLDHSEGNRMLTVQCLRCLNQSLERTIWNLSMNMTVSSSYEPNSIPEDLRYSCLHWASHLAETLTVALAENAVTEIQAHVSTFVEQHLLHWFECLSALRELGSGMISLDIAYEAISVSTKVASD